MLFIQILPQYLHFKALIFLNNPRIIPMYLDIRPSESANVDSLGLGYYIFLLFIHTFEQHSEFGVNLSLCIKYCVPLIPLRSFIVIYFHGPVASHFSLNSCAFLIASSGLIRNFSIALAVALNFSGACVISPFFRKAFHSI